VDWLTNAAIIGELRRQRGQMGSDNSKDYLNAKVSSGTTFNSSLTIATLLKTQDSSGRVAKMIKTAKSGCIISVQQREFHLFHDSDLTNNYLGTAFLDERPQ